MPAEKTEKTAPKRDKYPKAYYIFKPERCTNHRFALDVDGKTNFVGTDVDENTRCISCGLYFSTWIWYSEEINKSFWRGADSEADQTINYVVQEVEKTSDLPTQNWGIQLIKNLRDKKEANGKRI